MWRNSLNDWDGNYSQLFRLPPAETVRPQEWVWRYYHNKAKLGMVHWGHRQPGLQQYLWGRGLRWARSGRVPCLWVLESREFPLANENWSWADLETRSHCEQEGWQLLEHCTLRKGRIVYELHGAMNEPLDPAVLPTCPLGLQWANMEISELAGRALLLNRGRPGPYQQETPQEEPRPGNVNWELVPLLSSASDWRPTFQGTYLKYEATTWRPRQELPVR